MSETEKLKESSAEKVPKQSLIGYSRLILLFVAAVLIICLVIFKIDVFGNLVLTLVGFGAMVLVHEFGHFLLAKLTDIKVEAFSIGFPPILAGIRRTEEGYRVRILPGFLPSNKNEEDIDEEKENFDEGKLSFTIGNKGKSGETEYRIGLIPFGGFVKMLGQEDVGSSKGSDDPRSYANKPVGVRIPVIAGGVVFNVISAVIVFMVVFLIGIYRSPAIVGGVIAGFPAEKAGLRSGDEIIEIGGKGGNLDFSDIAMAAALSSEGEAVELKVRREDGFIEEFSIVAEEVSSSMGPVKLFGISEPLTLTIAEVSGEEELFRRTNLRGGDVIRNVNGKEIKNYWELVEEIADTMAPMVTLLAERKMSSGEKELIETELRLLSPAASGEGKSESDLCHIYFMVPRLRIVAVSDELKAESSGGNEAKLKKGDVILSVGEVDNPTYIQLREVTKEHEGKELVLKVLRRDNNDFEETLIVTVKPTLSRGRVVIGFTPSVDMEHAVVAKVIDTEEGSILDIPSGARITAVDGVSVTSFYEVVNEIRKYPHNRITIDYRIDENRAGGSALETGDVKEHITVGSILSENVPFKPLTKLYKASGPVDAIEMGFERTVQFIMKAYLSLQRLVSGDVSTENLMGPVGIVVLGYKVVSGSTLLDYVYLLGVLSVFIAVFNFLPFLPFDGGHIVFLLIEKIKGSPVNQRIQESIATVGWVLVGALAIYVTYNDIVRVVKGFLGG